MGDVRSITDNGFTQTGSEGTVRGIRLRNAAILRRMPWGDNWQWIRLGMMVSLETFGINRSGAQPGSGWLVGVCSGPWSVGDHASRTFRATGINIFNSGQAAPTQFDWHNNWTNTPVNGRNIWLNAGNGRGGIYYVSSSGGSYANGGNGRINLSSVETNLTSGGQIGLPDTTGSPSRRTAVILDIQRAPYQTGWTFRYYGAVSSNAVLASDITLKGYLASLGNDTTTISATDGWYNFSLPTISSNTQSTAIVDVRNAPMDYVDMYWDSYTFGLNLWRVDLKKFA